MNTSLSPMLEKFVQEKVISGLYTSTSEVIREALRLLYDRDDSQKQKVQKLRQDIDLGLWQLESGKKVIASESYARLKSKIDKIVGVKE